MWFPRLLTSYPLILVTLLACKGSTEFGPEIDPGPNPEIGTIDINWDGESWADGIAESGFDTDIQKDIPPVFCENDEDCAEALEAPAPWKCAGYFCQKSINLCVLASLPDGTPCEVRGKCEKDGFCDQGICVGEPLVCDDHNDCTSDHCDDTLGCLFTNIDVPCDDGNPCTDPDSCVDGTCTGEENHCPCADDLECLEKEDGNLCNGTLHCPDGFCAIDEATKIDCPSPDDPCIGTVCLPETGACVDEPANEGGECDDGNQCTSTDTCKDGLCDGMGILLCDDLNPCTIDSCLPEEGCVFETNNVICDDANICTNDICHPVAGCVYENNDASCYDGNECTVDDTCKEGQCVGGENHCDCKTNADCIDKDDGDLCNGTLFCFFEECIVDPATIIFCTLSQDPCLIAVCEPSTGNCLDEPTADDTPCDDQDVCSVLDACAGGQCLGTGQLDCNDGNPCTLDECDPVSSCLFLPDDMFCDDENICTDDVCDEVQGCQYAHNDASCDDGDSCTDPDLCNAGSCIAGPALDCNDINPCTEDSCDPGIGCLNTPIPDCTGCTGDGDCDDEDACNGVESCDLQTGDCVSTAPIDCTDDENDCTEDACDPLTGNCVYPALPDGTPCDDGLEHTMKDICLLGVCQGEEILGVFRVEAFADLQPTISMDLGWGPVVVNPLIEAYLTARLDTFQHGGLVLLFKPLSLGYPDASLKFGEGACLFEDGIADKCNIIPWGQNAEFETIQFSDTDPCSVSDPLLPSPCFLSPPAAFDLGSLLPDLFPGGVDEVSGRGMGEFTGDPIDWIEPGTVEAFLPKSLVLAAVEELAVDLGDLEATIQEVLSGIPTVLNGGIEGWNLRLGFKARRVDLLELSAGCNLESPPCHDGNVCTFDACDPFTGYCANPAIDCQDDDFCNGGETCDAALGCQMGLPPECDDGDVCNGAESCDASSGCQPGIPLDCDDGNPCTDDSCDMVAGCTNPSAFEGEPCSTPLVPDGVCTSGECLPKCLEDQDCDDADLCNGVVVCLDGVCVTTVETVVCLALDSCHEPGDCDPATGVCTDPLKPDGSECDDGDYCNGVSTCTGGFCNETVAAVVCEAPGPCHSAGICDPATGLCSDIPVPDGILCPSDDDPCTLDECAEGECIHPTIPSDCGGKVCGPSITGCHDCGECPDGEGCNVDGICDSACNEVDCPPCQACASGVCVPVAEGMGCDSDGNACTVDQCSSGECLHPPVADGLVCDDQSLCTMNDQCLSGSCIGAESVVCEPLDQCHDAGTCEPATGLCSDPKKAEGSFCDDGDLCTTYDSCQNGACLGSNPVECTALYECHDAGDCNSATGSCTHPLKPDGSECEDGNLCTAGDVCKQGICTAAQDPVICAAPTICQESGTCDPFTGQCDYPPKANGVDCDDGDLCNGVSTCQAGTCQETTAPVTCTLLDECHEVGICDSATGLCSNPEKTEGTDCDDGDLCNGVSTCQGGVCQETVTPVICTALNECHEVGVCDPVMGICSDPEKTEGSDCDDGDLCNGVGTCQAGTCQETTAPVTCTLLDECHEVGVCDSATGLCSNPEKTEGTDCDDGDLCNGVDTCQGGVCQETKAPVTCTVLDECHEVGVCDSATGLCSNPEKTEGTDCDDGDLCNGVDTCQGGVCQETVAPVTCSALNECHEVGICDPVTGVCSNPEKTEGTDCDDGDLCNGVSTCQGGVCQETKAPVTCTVLDECHEVGVCDSATGLCSNPEKTEGTDCDDGDLCNGVDTCQGGVCQETVAPVTCSALNECHEVGICDPVTGVCSNPEKTEGTDCDDGDLCNGVSTCQGGVCQETDTLVTCTALNECHEVGICDPITGICSDPEKADGAFCTDDEDPCTEDHCTSGECIHPLIPDDCQDRVCGPSFTGCHECGECSTGFGCNQFGFCDDLCSDVQCPPCQACDAGVCVSANDGAWCDSDDNVCTDDICAAGACIHTPMTDGTSCDDEDLCNGVYTCQTGDCALTTGQVVCTSLDECHDVGVCDPANGTCTDPVVPDDVSCDDGDLCNGVDTCQGGICQQTAGTVVCTALDDCHEAGACEPTTGACSTSEKPDDTSCDDGDLCNGVETCQVGVCTVTVVPVVCTALDSCHESGICNPGTGVCSDPLKQDNTSCDDGDLCNGNNTCQGGICTQVEPPVVCSALNECHDVGTCVPGTGVCSDPAKPDDTSCDDGNLCNGNNTCQGGICTEIVPTVVCSALDECHDAGTCDPGTGVCSDPEKPNDTSCDDGDLCNGVDTCQGGICTETVPTVVCSALDECHDDGTCDPGTGICSDPAKPDDTSCDDGDLCNGIDTCQSGTCTETTPTVVCTALDECHDDGTCDPGTGICTDPAKPDDTSCDDGDLCNGIDTCQSGTCTETTPTVVCTALDECHDAGTCDPGTGVCSDPEKPDDTSCDDGDLCNGVDTCQGGACTETTPTVVCSALDDCHEAGTCATDTGVCTDPVKPDDTSCDDGDLCNGVDTCQVGVCTETTTTVECVALDVCHDVGTCNPFTGICTNPSKADDADCDDGDLCNGVSSCQVGVCTETTPTVLCVALDVCHDAGTCDPGTGVCNDPAKPNDTNCDDEDVCNGVDTCQGGVCTETTAPLVCDDDDPCTTDSCQSVTGCSTTAVPGCIPCNQNVDCVTYDDGNICNGTLACLDDDGALCGGCAHGACLFDPNTIVVCPTHSDQCREWVCENTGDPSPCAERNLLSGTPCDDGDACTGSDACFDGACSGLAVNCDDGNLCTSDLCESGTGCLNVNNSVDCDDGDPCTNPGVPDTCSGGVCSGTSDPDCICSTDADCEEHEDGNLCNGTLVCVQDHCDVDPATVVTCPESTQCQIVECLPEYGICQTTDLPEGTACDDDDECTLASHCKGLGGKCYGYKLSICNDNDPCTDDSCDPLLGCTYEYNSADCDDDNPCTDPDRCVNGMCLGIPMPGCECVLDSDCLPYEDGDLCNGVLICAESKCVVDIMTVVDCTESAPDSCYETTCNPATGSCDDTALLDGRLCDDGNQCTTDDQCQSGNCAGTPTCLVNGDCSDGDVCTDDVCAPDGCCAYSFNSSSCDDGDTCTQDDTCHSGICTGNMICNGNCEAILTVGCGFGDNWSVFNPGATNEVSLYSCLEGGDFYSFGPEYTYRFIAPYDGTLTVDLASNGGSNDTSVLILGHAGAGCEGENCLVWDHTQAQTPIVAGQTYFIVVDGAAPSNGSYTIVGTCIPESELECDDGVDNDQDGQTDCDDSPDCDEACASEATLEWDLFCAQPNDVWWTYGPGYTDVIDGYSCDGGTWDGPEYAYSFAPTESGQYTISLSNMTGDLDLFVIEAVGDPPNCPSANCIVHGDVEVTFGAVAETTYCVVVDSAYGQSSYYWIHLECPCDPQCNDPQSGLPFVCGDDLCGGSCGECPQGQTCYGEQVDPKCCPNQCPWMEFNPDWECWCDEAFPSCEATQCIADPDLEGCVCGVCGWNNSVGQYETYRNPQHVACGTCQDACFNAGGQGSMACNQGQPYLPPEDGGYLKPLPLGYTQNAPCDHCTCENAVECTFPPLNGSQCSTLCSFDWIEYSTPCEMKKAYDCSDDYRADIQFLHACCPPCDAEPQPEDPKYCGSDGISYPNLCAFQNCAPTPGTQMPLVHLGACLNDSFCPECVGTPTNPEDTVCGADGVTYANECAATTATCGNTTVVSTGGACP